ncbi:MAG: diguanylate cyclase [Nitriliruptor sp.]|uniref:diguanylate cyclase n=1 Tax=Nitriliruptor sp. TaxID=2448056 RepID=UPI0034A066B1
MRFEAAFRSFAESIGVAVVVADVDGRVLTANDAAHELFDGVLGTHGVLLGSRAGDHPWTLLHEDGREMTLDEEPAQHARRSGEPVRDAVVGFVVRDGSPCWLLQSAVPLQPDDDPTNDLIISTFVDITARRELEARLEQQASADPLTGLANRLRYEEGLRESAERADLSELPVALMHLDVDDFKGINDLHGHAAGDGVLVAIADRIGSLVRATDTVARLGGDELAVVLAGADEERARALAEEILTAVAAPIRPARTLRGTELEVTVSIGLAVRESRGALDTLELAADEALLAAKHAGKGRYVVHDGATVAPGGVEVVVDGADAHAWAEYIDRLRHAIARSKEEGRLPSSSGAPDSIHRVLQAMLVRIRRVAPIGEVALELPRERDLGPFVFHQTNVDSWVARLRRDGIIDVEMSPEAERFWAAVRGRVDVVGL